MATGELLDGHKYIGDEYICLVVGGLAEEEAPPKKPNIDFSTATASRGYRIGGLSQMGNSIAPSYGLYSDGSRRWVTASYLAWGSVYGHVCKHV